MKRLLMLLSLGFLLVSSGLPAAAAVPGPLAPGEHSFVSNGVRLWYKVSGHGPVALLPTPGWGPSAEYLFLSLQPLERDFTIVYLETRATGRSQVPTAEAVTMEDFVGDLDNLRRHLKLDQPWLIGHSMGGTQILEYSLRHPQHVRGLLLLAAVITNNAPDPARQAEVERQVMQQVESRRGRPGFETALKAFKGDPPPTTDAEFKAQILATVPIEMYDMAKAVNGKDAFEQVRFSLVAFRRFVAGVRTDLAPALPRIQVPALVVAGADDVEVPWQQTLSLHRGLAHSKLILIPNAGHFAWLEQPDAWFQQVHDFLPAVGYRADAP